MRNEGFADDGLFDQMKPFFLPLTMVEQDIEVTDRQWNQLETDLTNKRTSLRTEKAKLEDEMATLGEEYYQLDDKLVQLKANARFQTTADLINSRDNQDSSDSSSLQQQMVSYRSKMDILQPRRNQLRTKWNQLNDLISNIETALRSRKPTSSDYDLIKPNRGFIMYGPPGKFLQNLYLISIESKYFSIGTGKSDIMSKVSTRIGINMVAPSIAAGELDRPLVGESERIISDICMRCHRLPYLMCCVSIDEIDSLAPKRTDKASHSDVSKLSVLLSVIEGIKDVRNLMFFCATNRIHMMDEAFLRRMSGKFFVGRPSSHARKAILSGMKTWHLNPSMLDDLAMATTNFSGAALRYVSIPSLLL
jgi:cell division protein FtsB